LWPGLPYGIIYHMKARLVLKEKFTYKDGSILELVIWKLPEPDTFRPHGIKYRLFYGSHGNCLVRYDNEKGKGDHRHIKDQEEPYEFENVEKLIADFKHEVEKFRGERNE